MKDNYNFTRQKLIRTKFCIMRGRMYRTQKGRITSVYMIFLQFGSWLVMPCIEMGTERKGWDRSDTESMYWMIVT